MISSKFYLSNKIKIMDFLEIVINIDHCPLPSLPLKQFT